MFAWTVLICWSFQSTLSVRRATSFFFLCCQRVCISIHALREESDRVLLHGAGRVLISIHALREESDPCSARRRTSVEENFNPRSP